MSNNNRVRGKAFPLAALQEQLANLRAEVDSIVKTIPITPTELLEGYTPLEVSKPFHEKKARFKTILAGVQSGKSYTATREFILQIYRDREKLEGPLQYWAVAPTFPLTRRQESLIKGFLRPHNLIVGELKSERILKLAGDITIQFKSGSNPDLLVAEPVNGMWIDEAARLKREAWCDNLEGRTTATQGWHLFTTSSKGRNWFYTTIVKPAEEDNPDYFSCSWRTEDNTSIPGIKEEMARKRRDLPEPIYKREYEASLDAFEGQVYNEWDPSIHIIGPQNRLGVTEIPTGYPEVMYGFDPAFGHAGALIVVIRMGDGTCYAVDELCAPEILPDYWGNIVIDKIKQWGRGIVYCDPSGKGYIKTFTSKGATARKAYNSVLDGVSQVSTLLHPVDVLDGEGNVIESRPKLFISPKCKQLIKELPSQRWGVDEKPFKQAGHEDDCADALRYSLARKH